MGNRKQITEQKMKFLPIIAAGLALTQTNALAIGDGDKKEAMATHRDANKDFRNKLEDLADSLGLFKEEENVKVGVSNCISSKGARTANQYYECAKFKSEIAARL